MPKKKTYRVIAVIVGIFISLLMTLIMLSPDEYYYLDVSVSGAGITFPPQGSNYCLPGNTSHLSAEPAPDSNQGFVRWEGDIASDADQTTIQMTGPKKITAVFSSTPPPGRPFKSLTIACAGPGAGSTQPSPGKYLHIPDKRISLAPISNEGAYFAGWTLLQPDSGTSAEIKTTYEPMPQISICVDKDLVVLARFETKGHTLSFEFEGEGAVAPAPGQYYLAEGHRLTAQATPFSGWRLRHWVDGVGTIVYIPKDEADTRLEIQSKSKTVYRAVFEKAERSLTLSTVLEGGALGSTQPSSTEQGKVYTVPYGETISLTAIPGDGNSAFAGWSGNFPGNPPIESLLNPEMNLNLTENLAITARFKEAETRLILEGTVDGIQDNRVAEMIKPSPGIYGFVRNESAVIDLHAPMINGGTIAFLKWEGNLPEGVDPLQQSIRLPMNEERQITAQFTEGNTLSVVLSHTGEGQGTTSIAPGKYILVSGQSLALKASPKLEGCFGGWKIRDSKGGATTSIDNPLRISPSTSLEIEALFGTEKRLIWIDAGDQETITLPAPGEYPLAKGTALDLSAHPPEGKYFHHWQTSEGVIISESPQTRIQVEHDGGYIAVSGPPLYALTLDTCGDSTGKITTNANRPDRLLAGAKVLLTAQPAEDSVFRCWEGDFPDSGNHMAPELEVVMDGDKTLTACFDKADVQLTLKVEGLETGQQPIILPDPGTRGYRTGTEVHLSAYPPPDSSVAFMGWSGDINSLNPECALLMDQNRIITARFAPATKEETATMTLLPPEGPGEGNIHPIGPGSYAFIKGAEISLSVHLGQDAYFGGWRNEAIKTIRYANLPVLMVQDITLGPVITDRGSVLTLMLDSEAGGNMEPKAGIYHLADGMRVILKAKRTNNDYTFVGWHTPGGNLLTTHGSYKFEISASSPKTEIIAVFREYIAPPEMVLCNNPFKDLLYFAYR